MVLVESGFVFLGAEISVGGVPASPVVEALDEVEQCGAGLVVGGEAGSVEEFTFEGGEERLGDRVDAPIDVKRPVSIVRASRRQCREQRSCQLTCSPRRWRLRPTPTSQWPAQAH